MWKEIEETELIGNLVLAGIRRHYRDDANFETSVTIGIMGGEKVSIPVKYWAEAKSQIDSLLGQISLR